MRHIFTLIGCLAFSTEAFAADAKKPNVVVVLVDDMGYGDISTHANPIIRSSKKAEKPFFIYLCTYSPHHPITLPDPTAADDYKKKVNVETAFFFAAIGKIDAQIGRLRQGEDITSLNAHIDVLHTLVDSAGSSFRGRWNSTVRVSGRSC